MSNLPPVLRVRGAFREDAHEQNQTTWCGRRAMWRPNSDRSDCNADRTSPGKQRCERGASTDGLQSLRPVLVAAELLRWLPCLRILPPSSLLASSLLSILILMMIAVAEHAAPLPLTKCSLRRHSTHCEFRLAMSALGQKQTSRNRKRPPNGSGLLAQLVNCSYSVAGITILRNVAYC